MSNCSCFSPELAQQALKKKKSDLHKVRCPVCGKEYTTNREGNEVVCFDCEKSGNYIKSNEVKNMEKTKIEILGSGCAKCNKTKGIVEKAVSQSGVEAEVIKVEDFDKIIAYGVMITPAVVVDGEVKVAGKVPSVDDVVKWITK